MSKELQELGQNIINVNRNMKHYTTKHDWMMLYYAFMGVKENCTHDEIEATVKEALEQIWKHDNKLNYEPK
jgi:hypothetical protein